MTTWAYFVSYAYGEGGLGFGNTVATRNKPILTIDDVQTLAREIEQDSGTLVSATRNVVIIGVTLLRGLGLRTNESGWVMDEQ